VYCANIWDETIKRSKNNFFIYSSVINSKVQN
jgi:hypothetical protein